ncbi:ArsR/SmtB family transcription factor [Novosphingopyxis sp.]|uniref:ArsR/SmtB family transcription factor n=1 Tax=Novosphingopyxis sp. TaxID=2709690 RepID=UPI003B597FF9
MEKMTAINRLSALAQPTRLDIFMTIAKHESGLSSTEIADTTNTLPTNTSVHLSILRNAGLVSSTKEGRTVTYKAERDAVRDLSVYIGRMVD